MMSLLRPGIRKIDKNLADAIGAKEILQRRLRFAMDHADMFQLGSSEAFSKMLHPSPRELDADQIHVRVARRLSQQKEAVAKTDLDRKWGGAPDKRLPVERPVRL
jgi:hypothetical protein